MKQTQTFLKALVVLATLLIVGATQIASAQSASNSPKCESQAKRLTQEMQKVGKQLVVRNQKSSTESPQSSVALAAELRELKELQTYLRCLTATLHKEQ
jgi:hypothetical protein